MAYDNARREADAFNRQPDPDRLGWKKTGRTRVRRFLWWTRLEREEQRLVYRPEKRLEPRESWDTKTRWVRA
jgi:hypothetical protein